ncbi:MAG: bifunctional phosphoglucose/phosphomannose isomerase [Candidatus Bathyarchaeia archaeon]
MSTSILDKPAEFGEIDKSSMILFHTQAAQHFAEAAKNSESIKLPYPKPENIVIAGMGGSAIGGELLKDYTRSTATVPIEISREYQLPAYAGKNSLVILASYSGDTEETLSSFADALKRKCMVFCVSSGGALIKYAEKLGVPYLRVKGGMPPRAALPHMLMPLLKCMQTLNMAPQFAEEFPEAIRLLEKVSRDNAPEKSVSENFAKTLALNLIGTSPVVYGFGVYRGVALRYKQQFNENSKIPAKWESFSELNHNETMGWENAKELANEFSVVFLRDKAEPVEIRSRIEITKALMKPSVSKMFEVWAQGKGGLARMLSTILVGDFASVYLAYLRGVDPTPVNTVTVMKQKIEQNGVKAKILRELEKLAAR